VQECHQQPLSLDGHTLRVNRARGDMPSWQQGPTRGAPQGGTGGHAGSAPKHEEHPKVRVTRRRVCVPMPESVRDDAQNAGVIRLTAPLALMHCESCMPRSR